MGVELGTAIATALGSVLVAFLTGLLTFLGTRSRAKVDVQATLNIGFNTLIGELQEERKVLQDERQELRNMVRKQDGEIVSLKARVERLIVITTKYHNFITTAGLTPPPFEENEIMGGNAAP